MSSIAPVAPAPAPSPPQRTDGPPRSGRRHLGAALLTAVGLAAVLLWALDVGGASGTAGAGRVVDLGVPLATLVGRVAAVGTVGCLLFAAVLLPGRDRALPTESRRALRAASAWALVWVVATAVAALLSLSRLLDASPTSLTWTSVQVYVEDTGAGRAALLVVALGAVLAIAAPQRSAAGARVLLGVALTALVLPVVLSGHSAQADDHVLAVTVISAHVVAATVWVGGLLALLVHGRRGPAAGQAATRYSRVALACFGATALTGVLAAWAVLGGVDEVLAALTSGYGALLVAKTAALALLGVFGWQHRRRTLPRLLAGEGRGFRRFATGEVVLMLATVALAVALASSPPPAGATPSGGPTAAAPAGAPTAPSADPMAGHDHGELSVAVLVDETRFHVAGPVAPGSRVTVHNRSTATATITADDGSFDITVPPRALTTFLAPQAPGEYRFASEHSSSFTDVLVVE